jgi:uncharacterized protein YcbK (DUF882 family)
MLALAILVRPTQDAVANGETRSLSMVNMHTGEKIDVTFSRNGRYDPDAMKQLNWFLRDWRRNEPTRMEPRLFDTVWAAYRAVGAREPVNVVCGYRAPETNAMLRRRSRGVAKFSQHTLGKAMDFYIPGVALASLRAAGLRLQRGGVGYYPTSGSPFVHMDAGSVRMWPRMTRQQLAAVFPDGKTVHIPTDGRPMPGYQAAYAELQRNGGTVGGFQGRVDDDAGDSGIGSLFGGFGDGGAPATSKSADSPHAVLMADIQRRSGGPAPDADAPAAAARKPAPVVVAAAEPAPAPVAAEPAAAPAPVVLAKRDIPLPERRPADLATARPAGPQLAWQTGPTGEITETAAVPNATMANVPLPPVRPGQKPAQDAVELASLEVPTPPAPARATAAQPLLQPGSPVMSSVAPDLGSLLRRAVPGAALPSRALGYAAAEMPIQQYARPALPALVATRFDHLDFAAATAPVSTSWDRTKSGLTRPDLDTVATLIPAPAKTVVIHFGVAAYQDLRAEKFSGAAIRPLRTASFALMPELLTGTIISAN